VPPDEPLVVHGPASLHYDFGHDHPFTPRRFGPGIDMLRALGASTFVDPREATDEELLRVHDRAFVRLVRMLSDYPEAAHHTGGFDGPDTPPFYGMHDAAATVAGGSLDAMDRILAGEVAHAFHPGGGLHHAMRATASGFCVYNDTALAIARARDAGHRVLYVDLDVHHGDGVERIFWDDPRVLTISIHESGLHLFPGTGFVEERGGHDAPGTAVNIPLDPDTSDPSWLAVVESVIPHLAEAFGPTVLVTQNGCDSHLSDPLAHLGITTAAMWRADRLLDEVAHAHASGRWLATGGGGYDVYRVVPRSWGLVWLAQAHRDAPAETPAAWRARWADEAARRGVASLPATMLDPASLVRPEPPGVPERNLATAARARDHSLEVLAERGGG
jgi:acetoin utilization protein AcuC